MLYACTIPLDKTGNKNAHCLISAGSAKVLYDKIFRVVCKLQRHGVYPQDIPPYECHTKFQQVKSFDDACSTFFRIQNGHSIDDATYKITCNTKNPRGTLLVIDNGTSHDYTLGD